MPAKKADMETLVKMTDWDSEKIQMHIQTQDPKNLDAWLAAADRFGLVSGGSVRPETVVVLTPERPVLVDKFLDQAMEIDVDAISDGENVVVAGIMQHIEEAGIHSGDSACIMPPQDLSDAVLKELSRQTIAMAKELKVVGLMNVQFAVKDNVVYVLEVNPRGSRTVPFVSKTLGVPLTKLATKAPQGIALTLCPHSRNPMLRVMSYRTGRGGRASASARAIPERPADGARRLRPPHPTSRT